MTTEQPKRPPSPGRRLRALAVAMTAVSLVVAGVLAYRWYAARHLSTDDAFVEGSIHRLAPRVAGVVSEVLFADNQEVRKGDVLLRLDREPLERSLAEAEAALRAEEGTLAELRAQAEVQRRRAAAAEAALQHTQAGRAELEAALAARRAEVQSRSAVLEQSRLDLGRARNLSEREVVPRSRMDAARTASDSAAAGLVSAEEVRRQAEAALSAHASAVAQARAQALAEQAAQEQVRAALATQEEHIARRRALADLARLNLSYTEIAAPVDGIVTRSAVEVGNAVAAGQPLLSLVSLEEAYVVANYKETAVGRIRPGQGVRLTLDAYPDREFEGVVDSVMAGTGSAFALFPPENASGNFVKVVQRVPVKITFRDLPSARPFLRVGMSVVPVVLTGE